MDDKSMDIKEIMKLLPHRAPFLLVDRVLTLEENKIVTRKNVTYNEPFFQGHFPKEPIMPGVLQVEAMAQTAGILGMKASNLGSDTSVYFLSIDKCKFRKPVVPGDTLEIVVEIIKHSGKRIAFSGKCLVDGQVVSQADQMLAMIAG